MRRSIPAISRCCGDGSHGPGRSGVVPLKPILNPTVMRRTNRIALLLAIGVCAVSCRKDEEITNDPASAVLRIDVVSEWEDQPFLSFTEYRAPGDFRFQGEMLRLYLSDLRLVNGTEERVIDQVRLLELGNGATQMEFSVPVGEWLGLRAGLGLPHDLNHTDPALYADGHPMSVNTGMYWSWASGYKFVLFDGRYNPDPASTTPLSAPFSVHTGMDTCFAQVDLFPAVPFTTAKGSITPLTLHIDVHGFLQSGPDTIHVNTENQSHGGNLPLALKLTRNVVRSMRLE